MKHVFAATLLICLVWSQAVKAQDNQSVQAKLDTIEAKLDQLQASVDALKPPPPKTTTSVLFPFATNQSGFDTGIAIANTLDGSGTCTWV
jgi:hypothetical protein